MSSSRTTDSQETSERYRRLPQLRDYDELGPYPRPYTTFGARSRARTPVVGTDGLGFRVSISADGSELMDGETWPGGGLVVGGSFVFGVGCTADGASIPSRLAALTGIDQLNLGVVGANSLQELVATIPFLGRAESVVLCTGFNTAFASLQSLGHNEVYGPLFFEGGLAELSRDRLIPLEGGDRRPIRNDVTDGDRPADRELSERALAARLRAAADRQLRDLGVLADTCRDRRRLLFCLQPFADPALRDLVPEEEELFAALRSRRYASPWTGVTGFLAANWAHYRDLLAAGCAELGVDFMDLSADRFAGWSFVDRVHLTDLGYRQAAELIGEAL